MLEAAQKLPKLASGLLCRNAIGEHAHILSDLVTEGGPEREPLVTIAIPTYRRHELLVEALASAAAQSCDYHVEIIVVDNDPATPPLTDLLERIPSLRGHSFRYYVNRENIGMFGNWNRCIELARGEWLTILNDDDLLDHDFLSKMHQVLAGDKKTEGLVCKYRYETIGKVSKTRPWYLRAARRIWIECIFKGRVVRPITFAHLFWSNAVGNGVGFLFRRSVALKLGGYYQEEFPSADYWFATRFKTEAVLKQHRLTLASVRLGENESAKPETLLGFIERDYQLQHHLTEKKLPRWWRRFSPMLAERSRRRAKDFWGADISREEVESRLGVRLGADRPRLLKVARAMLGGF